MFSEPTTPVPEPVTSPAVVRLTVTHTPVVRAALGSSKTIEARVGGPEGTVVQLFWGPENGPYDSRPMKASSTGTYRAMLSFDAPGKVQYWIVARHPEAEPSRVMSGDRFNPHVVSVL